MRRRQRPGIATGVMVIAGLAAQPATADIALFIRVIEGDWVFRLGFPVNLEDPDVG